MFIGGGNAANTHVVCHAGRILALVEVCLPTEVRPDLSTVGRYDFGGALRSPMTAHPKVDPRTGEMVFFGYDITGPPWLRYHVVDASGALVRTEPITIGGPAMVHDFAITETHVVWFDLPVVYDFSLLGKRPFPAEWKPEYPARVGVMPRDGGDADVRWIDVDPCYVYHPANAWNDDGRVVVDVPRYGRVFDHDLSGPADTDSDLRAVDHRPVGRQGPHRGARRAQSGFPADQRDDPRAAAPLRVHDAHRGGRRRSTSTAS